MVISTAKEENPSIPYSVFLVANEQNKTPFL